MTDNLSEYVDPVLYDFENPDFDPEGSFYLSLARENPGPILELGCGTGRMTIPIAGQGYEITGLDIVPEMLARAKEKAASLAEDNRNITWVEADARDYRLDRRFSLIFENGSVFMHMLSNADQEAFLSNTREHLAPQGRLVVSLYFPHPDRLTTDLEEKDWFAYEVGDGRSVRVSGFESYDEIAQIKTETAVRRILRGEEIEEVRVAPLKLRYTFPQEMERLLVQCGLSVESRFGGPDRSPLAADSPYMVYVCARS
jgi:SAM-dependent methyltransferase